MLRAPQLRHHKGQSNGPAVPNPACRLGELRWVKVYDRAIGPGGEGGAGSPRLGAVRGVDNCYSRHARRGQAIDALETRRRAVGVEDLHETIGRRSEDFASRSARDKSQ